MIAGAAQGDNGGDIFIIGIDAQDSANIIGHSHWLMVSERLAHFGYTGPPILLMGGATRADIVARLEATSGLKAQQVDTGVQR